MNSHYSTQDQAYFEQVFELYGPEKGAEIVAKEKAAIAENGGQSRLSPTPAESGESGESTGFFAALAVAYDDLTPTQQRWFLRLVMVLGLAIGWLVL